MSCLTAPFLVYNRTLCWNTALYPGMRSGFDKNSGKFYVAIDSNPHQLGPRYEGQLMSDGGA